MPERREELAAKRRARGHTQETLAHDLGVDVSSVARWERGSTVPSPVIRRTLAQQLGLSLDELGTLLTTSEPTTTPGPMRADELIPAQWTARHTEDLVASLAAARPAVTGDSAARIAHQWLLAEPPEGIATELSDHRERRIGSATITRISDRVQGLRYADDVLAGGDLFRIVQAELATTSRLLRRCRYTEQIGRCLLGEIAKLCELAGWSTADAGHDAAAEHYYLRGISAAHAAGDPVLAAHLVSGLAYYLADSSGSFPGTGRAADAVLLARSALARTESTRDHPWLTPTVRALLHARLAWAHARAGARTDAAEEMRRAADDYANRTADDPDPSWVYWLSTEEMEIIVGRCEIVTGHPDRAQHRLHHALRHCDPRHAREHTLYTTWLAEAYLGTHDIARARELVGWVHGRATSLASAFSHRAVTDLVRRIAGSD